MKAHFPVSVKEFAVSVLISKNNVLISLYFLHKHVVYCCCMCYLPYHIFVRVYVHGNWHKFIYYVYLILRCIEYSINVPTRNDVINGFCLFIPLINIYTVLFSFSVFLDNVFGLP